MKLVFFRNDDVRDKLDDSLVSITEIFIRNNVPVCHAVEPANVSPEVVQWLLAKKKAHPRFIEIVQHGYNHNLNYTKQVGGVLKKGEFGGNRTYKDQLADLRLGKERMDDYFGENWFPLITFPYGARNKATIDACRDLGFLVVNGSVSPTLKHQVFSMLGRTLNREYLLGRKVSWNLRYRYPNKRLFQIDLAVSLINKYNNEFDSADFATFDELKLKFELCKKIPNVGFLLHHRYHNEKWKIDLIERLLSYLKKESDIKFVTQEQIYYALG